ncbi:MAG: YceI family protein [Proteobacteria bacterium]|nr:YceI family protein [Pseudomonadota bacterium]
MFQRFICAACLTLLVFAGTVNAKTASYDFSDPKGVNAISIVLDGAFEPNVGFASPTQGTVTIDTDTSKIVSGKISVPTNGVTMTNSTMTKVLQSSKWLDAEKNPMITFEFLQTVSMGTMTPTKYQVIVEGNLSIAGVTKKVSAPISLTFFPGQLKDRNPNDNGDLVVLRSNLQISRKDFNLNPGTPETLVSDTISLVINLAGAHRP